MAEHLAPSGIELATIASGAVADAGQTSQQRPKISIYHAARDNREQLLDEWIAIFRNEGSKLNKRDAFGFAPIHYAAKFNHYNILVKLVDAGADPNLSTKEEKYTPLHFAAFYSPHHHESPDSSGKRLTTASNLSANAEILHFLVTLKGKKVEVNARGQYGLSALHLACQNGNKVAVDVLLRCNDINVYIKDSSDDTPLHEACLNGHHDIVETVVKRMKLEDPKTAEIDAQNSESQTPLHLACREGHVEVVKVFLKHVFEKRASFCKTRDNEENTALHLACKSGSKEIVKILIMNGADLYAKQHKGITPIHIAVQYGFIEVAKILMQNVEALPTLVDIYHQTPLHHAAYHNQVDMIKFLVENGADITATDAESYTPLMLAAVAGHVDAFNALLDRGSAIHKSVLHLAAVANHTDVLRSALRKADGIVNSTDSSYNTPLHLAAENGNVEAVGVLLQIAKKRIKIDAKNGAQKTPMLLAASKGHILVMKALLEFHVDCMLEEDEDGNNSLHLAALNGHSKAVKLLLDSHADYSTKSAKAWTAMDLATTNGHENVVKVLIDAGAEVNPVEKQKPSPLHLATQEGHLNLVQFLLQKGANASKCDKNGLNSLDVAIDSGHEDIALCIIQSDQWKSVLRHTTETRKGSFTTPLRKLIERMPSVAGEVFSRCCTPNDTKDGSIRPESRLYNVVFNYEFLEDFRDDTDNACSRFIKRRTMKNYANVGDDVSVKSHDRKVQESRVPLKQPRSSGHGFSTTWGPPGFKKDLHPLAIMVENKRTDLLNHPLVTSLLRLKWRTYGRYAYFLNLLIYVVFVLFITAFALVSLNPQSSTCTAVFDNRFGIVNSDSISYINDSSGCVLSQGNTSTVNGQEICADDNLREMCNVPRAECGECEGLTPIKHAFLYVSAAIVIAIAGIRSFLELTQLLVSKLKYLFDWVNWMEVITFGCAIAFTFVFFNTCLCPTGWQWQLGCVAVFLTWIDLVIFIQKLPLTGIYVLMFVNIFYTFCKVIILTILLILSFSIVFYMAFFDPSDEFARSSFATPGRAILKTMTMTTGEFEYDSIFRQFPGGADDGGMTDEIPFPPVSFLLWIIFLVLMPILLTNLLVGLAVDDIKGIQDAAILQRLALQVDLALSIEQKLPTGLRRFFIRGEYTVVPNRKRSFKERLQLLAFGAENSRYDSAESISNALHPQPTPIEQIHTQTSNLMSEMKKMTEAIHELRERNGTSTDHSHTQGLASEMKKLNQTVSELAKRNTAMEKLLLKMTEEKSTRRSHI